MSTGVPIENSPHLNLVPNELIRKILAEIDGMATRARNRRAGMEMPERVEGSRVAPLTSRQGSGSSAYERNPGTTVLFRPGPAPRAVREDGPTRRARPRRFDERSAFIVAYGLTHPGGLLTLWCPLYGLEGLGEAMTAMVSIATAVVFWQLIPQRAAIPSPAAAEAMNRRPRARRWTSPSRPRAFSPASRCRSPCFRTPPTSRTMPPRPARSAGRADGASGARRARADAPVRQPDGPAGVHPLSKATPGAVRPAPPRPRAPRPARPVP